MSEGAVEVGEVLIEELEPGVWGAVQVVGFQGNRPVVASMRWIGQSFSDKPPSVTSVDVANDGAVWESHHAHTGDRPTVLVVEGQRAHWRLRSVGVTDPVATPETVTSSLWTNATRSGLLQHRWEALPEDVRAEWNSPPPSIAPDAADVAVSRNGHYVQLGPEADLRLLEQFRWVSDLRVRGDPPALSDWLRGQHGNVGIEWTDPPERIDLSGLRIDRLLIEGPVKELSGFAGVLHVDSDTDVPLLASTTPRSVVLERAETDVAELVRAMPTVTELWIVGRGPGAIKNVDRFPDLVELRSLRIADCYRFDPDSIPHPDRWPYLHTIDLWHVPRRIADDLRRQSGPDPRVVTAGLRSDAWIRDNAENPFGHWIDDSRRLGRGAAKAWKAASKQMDQLAPDPPLAALRKIILTLVEELNALDDKTGGGIDTLRREEAIAAILLLARRHSPTGAEDEIQRCIDESRTW